MRVRTAMLTGLTGLMLNMGLAGGLSAQTIYRYPDGSLRYRDGTPVRQYMVDSRIDTRWEARQIVRQAYRDILRREPDASGLRQYVDAMLYEGWSEGDVRRSLANSREYRQRFGRVGFWRYR